MKKITVLTMVAFSLAVGAAGAADTLSFKRGVSFDHKAHKAAVKKCSACHDGRPGKIAGFGKEWAHAKGCKSCHAEGKKGPTDCKGCHGK